MRISMLVGLLLAGCSGAADKADDTGGETGGGDTNDTVDETVAPEILSIDLVQCTQQQSAGEVWQMQLTVDDPQGADTIASGAVSVQNEEGGELANYDIACNDGSCIGSFRADYDGITCASEGSISFVFQVTDEDGNVSATKTHPG